MIVYYIYFNILLLLSVFEDFYKKNKVLDFLAYTITIFFIGFRYQLGTDWYHYKNNFNMIDSINKFFIFGNNIITKDVESGFSIFMSFVKSLGVDFEYFTFIISLIYFLLLRTFFIKFNKKEILALILFLSFYMYKDFDLLKQMLAFGLCIYSLNYLKNKKKYFFFIFIAMLFHKTALIYILFYFFYNKTTITKKKLIFIFGCYFLIILFKIDFINIFITILTKIDYFSKYIYLRGEYSFRGVDINFLINLFVFIIALLIKWDYNSNENIYLKMFTFNILITLLSAGNTMIQIRLTNYFIISFVGIIITFYSRQKDIFSKLIVLLGIYGFICAKEVYIFSKEPFRLAYTPYKNYFLKDYYNEEKLNEQFNRMKEEATKMYEKMESK